MKRADQAPAHVQESERNVKFQALIDTFPGLKRRNVSGIAGARRDSDDRSLGSGTRLAAVFVVSVWDGSAFDLMHAWGAWDVDHRNAWKAWAADPWWP